MRWITTVACSVSFFAGVGCFGQDRCRVQEKGPDGVPHSASEVVYQLLLITPLRQRTQLWFGDAVYILRCGTQKDAAEYFDDVHGSQKEVYGLMVVGAARDYLLLTDDVREAGPPPFRFQLERALDVLPHRGDRVLIRGIYTSYRQQPFEVDFDHSSFEVLPRKR